MGELREKGRREIARQRERPVRVDICQGEIDVLPLALRGECHELRRIRGAGQCGAQGCERAAPKRRAADARRAAGLHQQQCGARPKGDEQIALDRLRVLLRQQQRRTAAPRVELHAGSGVDVHEGGERGGADAGHPEPLRIESLNLLRRLFDGVRRENTELQGVARAQGELQEGGADIDAGAALRRIRVGNQ